MNRMKELRVSKALKQKDVAIQTGLSRAAISLFENNKATPSMNSALKIAKVLDTSIEQLFPLDVSLYEKEESSNVPVESR